MTTFERKKVAKLLRDLASLRSDIIMEWPATLRDDALTQCLVEALENAQFVTALILKQKD